MGGGGLWRYAAKHGRFAALVPVCAAVRPMPSLLEASCCKEATSDCCPPVWAFHGANDEVVPVQGFSDYVSLFQKGAAVSAAAEGEGVDGVEKAHTAYFSATANKQWEVAVMASPSGSFENISFVNSVWTPRGGSHVGLVTMQIVNAVEEALGKIKSLTHEQKEANTDTEDPEVDQ